jgi:hypothetical protein
MCVLLLGLGSARPSAEELANGVSNNPDGFAASVLFHDGSKLRLETRRSMHAREGETMLGDMLDLYGDRVQAWAWHARIATSGRVDISGCHGFPIGGDPRTVLYHNGVLPLDPAPGLSDTATMARDMLPSMGGAAALSNAHVFGMVSDWATGSKLAVLSADPDLDPVVLINEDAGDWVDDIWFSNTSCWSAPRRWSSGWADDDGLGHLPRVKVSDDSMRACKVCDGRVDAIFDETCVTCGSCVDCGGWNCRCYDSEPETCEACGLGVAFMRSGGVHLCSGCAVTIGAVK